MYLDYMAFVALVLFLTLAVLTASPNKEKK